jgi:hypothetical protein
MDIDQSSFIVGFFFGFVFAGILGTIFQHMRQAWHGMGAPDRPMHVQTRNTPRRVMGTAAAALGRLIRLLLLFLIVLAIGAWLFYWIAIGY